MVSGEIGFTFHSVYNYAFGLAAWRWRQLDVAREGCTAQADNTGFLYFINYSGGIQFGTVTQTYQLGTAVNSVFPFIAIHVNKNGLTTGSAGINHHIHFGYRSAHTAVYWRTDKSAGFCNHSSHFHHIALLNDGLGGRTDMLEHAEYSLFGQCGLADGTGGREFVFCGMNPAYLKCLHVFGFIYSLDGVVSSFLTGAVGCSGVSTLGLRGGKLNPLIAPLGQASSHLRHILHFSASM